MINLLLLVMLAQSNVRITGTVPSGTMIVERVNSNGSINLIAKPRIFDGVLDVTLKSNTGTLSGTLYKITFSTGVSENWNIPSSPTSNVRAAVITSGGGGGGGGGTPLNISFVSEPLAGLRDGTNTVFILSATPISEPLIFVNGVKQALGLDYTRISRTITFTTATTPRDTDILSAWYVK